MAEEESIVQKPKEPLTDAVLPQNADELAKFMNQPLSAIAEAITGALAAGPKAWSLIAGHIVQGILKGKLFQQVSQEIKKLREKGKIPDDFADEKKHKYGFKSWVELLTIIDEETPDSDRLKALKAMFYGINKINATDGERIAGYQLFQIAKKLTSSQLLYLRACYHLYKEGMVQGESMNVGQWLGKIGQVLGHFQPRRRRPDRAILGASGCARRKRCMPKLFKQTHFKRRLSWNWPISACGLPGSARSRQLICLQSTNRK